MTKSEWWSTMSDTDGKTYYFKRDSHGKVHRVSKYDYKSHLKKDVPKFEKDGKTPSGPRYWTVGTTGKNGESEYVVMRKVAGDSNVYTLDPKDIHGDLAHDAAAMKRIGSIINKHKATLRASDPIAEIPEEVIYNLNSSLASSLPNMMNRRMMSVPTISTDSINTAAAFNHPYSTLVLTNLKQITIPVSSVNRRTCMDVATAQKDAEKYHGSNDSFHACMGQNCDFVLTIQKYNEAAYNTTENILVNIAPDIYPVLIDHWPCSTTSSSYWLYNVKDLTPLTNEDLDDEEKKSKINDNARKLVGHAAIAQLYLGKKANEFFTVKDFLQKKDGSLVFWNCCSTAYFPTYNRVQLAGLGIGLFLQPNQDHIPGDFIKALELNNNAISNGVQKSD